MFSPTVIIFLCVGIAAAVLLGVILSRWDAKRYKSMYGQEKREDENEKEDNGKQKK